MARKKKNKYRLVTSGLKIEQSVYYDFCKNSSETEIIETILISMRYFSVLESFREGTRKIELVPLRVHKDEELVI